MPSSRFLGSADEAVYSRQLQMKWSMHLRVSPASLHRHPDTLFLTVETFIFQILLPAPFSYRTAGKAKSQVPASPIFSSRRLGRSGKKREKCEWLLQTHVILATAVGGIQVG